MIFHAIFCFIFSKPSFSFINPRIQFFLFFHFRIQKFCNITYISSGFNNYIFMVKICSLKYSYYFNLHLISQIAFCICH